MNSFKFGPEAERKCVICVSDKLTDRKKSEGGVDFYIYDKNKYAVKRSRGAGEHTVDYVEPIGSIDYCHLHASYITFGSLLFRIGGKFYGDLEKIGLNVTDPAYVDTISSRTQGASRTVDIIDLNTEDDSMVPTKGPEMNVPRSGAYALILEGKLYVAGGLIDYGEDLVFMEVLNKSAAKISDWFWEPLPNPPLSLSKELCCKVIIGAVESSGVIVVGFGYNAHIDSFYTYKPRTKTWEFCTTYTDIPFHPYLDFLTERPAVVSSKFMLWLAYFTDESVLYVMDLENGKIVTVDLRGKGVVPSDLYDYRQPSHYNPILLKLKEGKFCVFWADWENDPFYTCGPHSYVGLHASTFTLERSKEGTLYVKPWKNYCSLIPRFGGLEEVCIADVPDSKRHNKQWTPFC